MVDGQGRAAGRRRRGRAGCRCAEAMGGGDPRGGASVRALNDQMGVRKAAAHDAADQPAGRLRLPGLRVARAARHARRLEFCENGAKAVAEEATTRRVTADFFAAHTRSPTSPAAADHWLGQQGRLTEPMLPTPRAPTTTGRSRWDDAFDLDRRATCGPWRRRTVAVFYTSGRTSNEAAFLYQLFVRAFGTNNLPDCSNMCHESSGVALAETIGVGKGTVTLDDIHARRPDPRRRPEPRHQPPADAHRARAGQAQRRERSSRSTRCPRPGCIALPQPAATPAACVGRGTALADLFLPVARRRRPRPVPVRSTACSSGARRPIDRDAFVDRALRRASTSSPTTSRRSTRPALLAATGPRPATSPRRSSTASPAATRIVVCWAMGLTQHRNAVATIREIVNIAAAARARSAVPAPGCARCAATATCRATARWASTSSRPERVPRRARRPVRLRRRRASTATTPSTRSRRCATATSTCSSAWAATSSPRRRTPTSPRRRCERCAPDRAGLDQAQPLAPRPRRARR